jgi:hypothetical protein
MTETMVLGYKVEVLLQRGWIYPSKSSACATCNQKQGYFESLNAYVGVTFAREDVPRCFSSSDGLLEHTKEEAEWINKLIIKTKRKWKK